MKRLITYLIGFISAIILLVILLLASTQTALFKNYLKGKVIQAVNSKSNLSITIEKLEGNLYRTLSLKNVEATLNDTLFASFSSLKVEYDIFALKNRQIILDTIILEIPKINCIQYSDSSWNFQHLLTPDKNDTLTSKNSEFNFEINTQFLSIRDGLVTIHSYIDILPVKITDLNLDLKGLYKINDLAFHLQSMNFKTQNPTFQIDTVNVDIKIDDTGIHLNNFLFCTSKSKILTQGFYNFEETLNASLSANKLDKDEFKIFVPKLNLVCSPEIKSKFLSENDSTHVWLELFNINQSIKAETSIYLLNKALSGEKVAIHHFTSLSFNNVVPEDWMDLPETKLVVNGEVKLTGKDLLNLDSPLWVQADFKNLVYSGEIFDKLLIKGIYTTDSINSTIELQTQKGNANINGTVKNIYSFPEYKVRATTKNLNLSSFFAEMEDSYVTGNIDVSGSGFNLSNLVANGTILLENSKLYHVPIDSVVANIKFENNFIEMNSLNLFTNGGWLQGTGNYDLKTQELTSEFHSELDSLTSLNYFFQLPVKFKSFKADANITGQATDLQFSGNGEILNTDGYSTLAKKVNASFTGRIKTDSITANLLLDGYNLESNSIMCDSVKLAVNYFNKALNIYIKASFEDSLNTIINARAVLVDTIEITIDSFQVNTLFSQYYMNDNSQTFRLNKNDIHIQNLWIKDKLNPKFALKLNGDLSLEQHNEFSLLVENLDLYPFNRFLSLSDSIKGTVSSEVNISGTIQNPAANMVVTISKPEFGPLTLSEIAGKVTLSDKLVDAQISILEIGNGTIASIKIPVDFHVDSAGFIVQQPDSFNAEITLDSLFFSQIYNNNSLSNINMSGTLNSKIQASGNFRNPQFYGNIYLKDGNISDDVLGILYDKIDASVSFNGKKIILDTFLINQNAGFLTMKGNMEFDSSLVSGKVINTSVFANASNFNVAKNRNHQLLLDANTFLKMGTKQPEFGGEINVIQSNFNLGEFSSEMKKNDETDIPLLLQAISKQVDSPSETEEELPVANDGKHQKSTFLNDITGRLKVLIPHNTWIRSEYMNLELNGDFDVVKNGSYFEIFGTVGINRGNYIIYGKKLSIKEGEITFRGGEKIDPEINLRAELAFKGTDKVNHTLELSVSDNFLDPTITFTLDNNGISETEAMAILIFGKTSEELALTGQGSMVSSLGAGKLSQMITSQLTKTLGSTFDLDLIEVASTDNWQSASFVVGKYITNDLFVTYQRGFGETEGDEITPRKITLEYKLNRLLFLQLQSGTSKSSGLDIILKFEKKERDK